MGLRGLFQFRNEDSTQALNQRATPALRKGVFDPGAVHPSGAGNVTTQLVFRVPGQLTVQVIAFAAVGSDGMMVVNDAPPNQLLPVTAGIDQYILMRSTYSASGAPDLAFEVKSTADWLGLVPSEQARRIILARINLGAFPGAIEVLDANISLLENDLLDRQGRDFIRGVVTTSSQLPIDAPGAIKRIEVGDVYLAITQRQFYRWDGVAWLTVTDGAIAALITNHIAVADPAHPATKISFDLTAAVSVVTNRVQGALHEVDLYKVKKDGDFMTGALTITTAAGAGLTATGASGFPGVRGNGGTSSGIGVDGAGGTTNGVGVRGRGEGTGAGVYGFNVGTGPGVKGDSSGFGAVGGQFAALDGPGITATAGGATDFTGGQFTGSGNFGTGAEGQGAGTSGIGVSGIGGGTDGIGVTGTGFGPSPGVRGEALGTGPGVKGEALGTGPGVKGEGATGGVFVGTPGDGVTSTAGAGSGGVGATGVNAAGGDGTTYGGVGVAGNGGDGTSAANDGCGVLGMSGTAGFPFTATRGAGIGVVGVGRNRPNVTAAELVQRTGVSGFGGVSTANGGLPGVYGRGGNATTGGPNAGAGVDGVGGIFQDAANNGSTIGGSALSGLGGPGGNSTTAGNVGGTGGRGLSVVGGVGGAPGSAADNGGNGGPGGILVGGIGYPGASADLSGSGGLGLSVVGGTGGPNNGRAGGGLVVRPGFRGSPAIGFGLNARRAAAVEVYDGPIRHYAGGYLKMSTNPGAANTSLPSPAQTSLTFDGRFVQGNDETAGVKNLAAAPFVVSPGTADFTASSPTVSGTGTTWLTQVERGSWIQPAGGSPVRVESVDSDTQMTLTKNYPYGNNFAATLQIAQPQLNANGGNNGGDMLMTAAPFFVITRPAVYSISYTLHFDVTAGVQPKELAVYAREGSSLPGATIVEDSVSYAAVYSATTLLTMNHTFLYKATKSGTDPLFTDRVLYWYVYHNADSPNTKYIRNRTVGGVVALSSITVVELEAFSD